MREYAFHALAVLNILDVARVYCFRLTYRKCPISARGSFGQILLMVPHLGDGCLHA